MSIFREGDCLPAPVHATVHMKALSYFRPFHGSPPEAENAKDYNNTTQLSEGIKNNCSITRGV